MSANLLIPKNESDNLKALDFSVDKRFKELKEADLNLLPSDCKEDYLEHLARLYELDVSGLTIEQKRELIKVALRLKKYQGSAYALKKALNVVNNAELLEWFTYGGTPYHFKINVKIQKDKEYLKKRFELINWIVEKHKNVRSFLEYILLLLPKAKGDIAIYGGAISHIKLAKRIEFSYQDMPIKIFGFMKIRI